MASLRWVLVLALVSLTGTLVTSQPREHWLQLGKAELKRALDVRPNTNVAKNVIVFIGDGMSLPTIAASRMLDGQLRGESGEDGLLSFEKFVHVALAKPFPTDRQVSDSAAAATGILCGVKSKYYTTGVDDSVKFKDCSTVEGAKLDSILNWSQDEGKSTGVVTTARITHATPAASYAHAADRDWEGDARLPEAAKKGGCKDIAYQLVRDNPDINVLFGGGRRFFLPNTTKDPETKKIDENQRQDGLNLIEEWKTDKTNRGKNHKFVWNNKDFNKIDPAEVDYALGLFEPAHMQYELERNKGANGEPSLSEMASKAIKILQKNDNGFFLLVEGARIDHAHHDNLGKKALYETLGMDSAVKKALELTNEEETLIIVTADHSNTFNLAGYAYRGNPILGVVDPMQYDYETTDNITYTTLLYATGPGYDHGKRVDPKTVDTTANDYVQVSAVPNRWNAHGGEDVAVYAHGPMAHLFHGVHDQHYIAHAMAYASCVGSDKSHCTDPVSTCMSVSLRMSVLLIAFAFFCSLVL